MEAVSKPGMILMRSARQGEYRGREGSLSTPRNQTESLPAYSASGAALRGRDSFGIHPLTEQRGARVLDVSVACNRVSVQTKRAHKWTR